MQNVKEFYRVYMNMRNLSVFLRKEIYKIHNENLRLKKLNTELVNKSRATRVTDNYPDRHASSQNFSDELGKKFYKLDKFDSLVDVTVTHPARSNYTRNEHKIKKFRSQQNINQMQSNEPQNHPEKSSNFLTSNSNANLYGSELALDFPGVHLLKATPQITTIGKAIEEAEFKMAVRRNINPNKNTHSQSFYVTPEQETRRKNNYPGSSSSSSFSSSGYCSQRLQHSQLRQSQIELTPGYGHNEPFEQTFGTNKHYSSIEISPSLNHSPISYATSPSSMTTQNRSQSSTVLWRKPQIYRSFSNLNYQDNSKPDDGRDRNPVYFIKVRIILI